MCRYEQRLCSEKEPSSLEVITPAIPLPSAPIPRTPSPVNIPVEPKQETTVPACSKSDASKRDRRRAKESRKKQEEPVVEKTKGFKAVKSKGKAVEESLTEARIAETISGVREKQGKLSEKWSEHWSGELSPECADQDMIGRVSNLLGASPRIICLGIGKPYTDRSAQIQLALLLELRDRLGSPVQAYDPQWDEGDKMVMALAGVDVLTENKVRRGACAADTDGRVYAGPPSRIHAALSTSTIRGVDCA